MTTDEMIETLSLLGIEVSETRGSEIQARCPAHVQRTGHEDRNPSWWINADTGAHICFSCQFKGGLQSLVSYMRGIDFEASAAWLSSGEGKLSAAIERIVKPKEEPKERVFITESMLSAFTNPPTEALMSRGISHHAAEYYEILWDASHSNWITVIRDPQSEKLMGWQEKGHSSRYFKNFPSGVQKSKALFGYRQFNGGEMIVVESPLDVARLASVGIFGGISTYGALVSPEQFKWIRSARRVIFAMDNDEAGIAASLSLLKMCVDQEVEAWFFNYSHTDMKDVGAMSKEEIKLGIETARHMVHGDSAIVLP